MCILGYDREVSERGFNWDKRFINLRKILYIRQKKPNLRI